jgi:hypothetical protein
MSPEILPSKGGRYWAYFFGNPAFMFEITLNIGRMAMPYCINFDDKFKTLK